MQNLAPGDEYLHGATLERGFQSIVRSALLLESRRHRQRSCLSLSLPVLISAAFANKSSSPRVVIPRFVKLSFDVEQYVQDCCAL
jgi:hypothetical protein